ncbi:MAG: MurR/RpiR family transcriptional regulator [Solirubrobacteraceae bacterium]
MRTPNDSAAGGDWDGVGCTVRVQSMFETFTPAERRVAQAILEDSDAVLTSSITKLAELSGASEAAVSRFARRVGYASFAEFKLALARDLVAPRELLYEEVEVGDDAESVLAKVAAGNVRAIEAAVRAVDQEALAEAARRISTAGRVAFAGFGGSAVVAQDAMHQFMRVLPGAVHLLDAHERSIWATLAGPSDVLVVSSHSGASREAVELTELAARRGAFVIAITNHRAGALARAARIALCTAAREGRFREESLSSRAAALTLVDALYVLVALARPEQVAERSELIREALAATSVPLDGRGSAAAAS